MGSCTPGIHSGCFVSVFLTFVSDCGVYPTLTNSKLLCVLLYAFMSDFLQAFPVIYLMTACNVIALTGAELKEVHGGSHLTCWREPLCLFVLRIIIPRLNWSSYWTWLWVPLFIQCTRLLKIRAPYHSYSRWIIRNVVTLCNQVNCTIKRTYTVRSASYQVIFFSCTPKAISGNF